MREVKRSPDAIEKLRERAQAVVAGGEDENLDLSPGEIRRLVNELHTHQIELELQNEDLRVAQDQLMEVHERVSDLYEFAPVGYISVAESGLIQGANLTLAEMLKLERGLFIKRPFSSFVVLEDQDVFYESRRQVYALGMKAACELRLQPAGQAPVFWAALDIVPVQANSGGQTGELRIAVSDISEKRHAQDLAAAATAERLEFDKRLEQTQRLESLGVMAGGIAHDFNNILQVIGGNIDLAIGSFPEGAEGQKYLQAIAMAAARAADLTDQMLAYSGGGTLEVCALDLSALTREMANLLAVSHKKKAMLLLELGDKLPAVLVAPTQVRQVIMNLITNASDAIGDTSGTITLRTGTTEISDRSDTGGQETLPPGPYVYLQVADTGCGMNKKTLKHMFDPFFTTKFQGRGLGLAAVRGIVLSHHGEIRMETTPGHGTTATVLLPAHGPLPETPAVPASKGKLIRGSGTILIVDDEDSIRTLLSMILKKCGYTVYTASDGEEALTVFREHQNIVDCVLLDLTMPHMGGFEAGAKLRVIKPGIKIILLSGYRDLDIPDIAENQCFDGFLKKPVGYERLVEMVRSVMAG